MRVATWTVATLVGVLLAATACTPTESEPEPVPVAWHEVALPAPPAGERNVVRAAAVCDGRWYLVGAYGGAADDTRPAAWSSDDGEHWSAMAVAAESYYGVRSVLYTAGCRQGRLAAIGGKPGGAHGNPRVSSYHLVPAADGTEVLTEVLARFELYGGPTATNVGRLSAGPDGWIITGNRSSGAAVWLSSDASRFELLEGAPGLATTPERVTWASDAAGHNGRWVVVGGTITTGRIDRDAAAWTSADGSTWVPVAVPGSPEYDEMSVVAKQGDGLVAVGQNGSTFQAWRLTTDGWQLAGRFGSTRADATPGARGTAVAAVDIGVTGGTVVAAVVVGGANQLWWSSDGGAGWRPAPPPIPMPAGSDKGVAVAGVPGQGGSPDRVLVCIDDGNAARVFLADVGA
jgi:hypothetical protein